MPSNLLPTEPTYSSGTTDEGEYLSAGDRKAIFKKRRVSGADFKRGSSAGSSVGEARGEKLTSKDFGTKTGKLTKILRDTRIKVNLNEKKIAALEVADTKELEPAQDQAQPTESLIGPLKTIDNSVNGIVETLKASNKADAKAQSDARKQAEKDARNEKEGKLEGIGAKLSSAAQTVLKPVQSIFSRIWDFLKIVFLGRVVMKLFDWFTDDANKEKVASLFRFLKDWWPVLVAGIMAVVGPGMIFTAGLIALLVWGVPKIIEAVKWVGSLFGIGVNKELKGIEKESAKMGDDITDTMDKDLTKDAEEITDKQAEVSDTQTPATDVTPPEVGETQQQAKDVQTGADQAEPLKMAGGGQVPGSGSGDTVPAMLTPGEFVMSKGAVQQYGSGTLAGMNAAAGGTNRPIRGRYNTGGMVHSSKSLDVPSVTYSRPIHPLLHYKGGGVVQYFKGGGEVKKPQGMMRWLAGAADVATGGLFDFDKRGSMVDGMQELFGKTPARMVDTNTGMKLELAKSSPSIATIEPPGGRTSEADPIAEANIKLSATPSQGQQLPDFSATHMRSDSKIKTLGIVV